jgi:hypothetical protein
MELPSTAQGSGAVEEPGVMEGSGAAGTTLVVFLRTAKMSLAAVNAGLPPDKTYKRRAAPTSAQKAIGVSMVMVVAGPPFTPQWQWDLTAPYEGV